MLEGIYSLDVMYKKMHGRKMHHVQDIISKARALKTCHYTIRRQVYESLKR